MPSTEFGFYLESGAFAVVVSGPSGVGKSSVCDAVLARNPGVRPCVTSTTRPKRDGEKDGADYHFLSERAFLEKRDSGGFVEWARVYGYYYGATVDAVSEAMSGGRVMLLDVDVQGAETWRRVFGAACVTVFFLPPSMAVLKQRLEGRRTEGAGALHTRLEEARTEILRAGAYDYAIVNDRLEQAVLDLEKIIDVEKLRPRRMPDVLSRFGVAGG